MKKIAILGGSGFVGRNLVSIMKPSFDVHGFDRKGDDVSFFDFSDPRTWENIFLEDFDVIINTAAYGVVKTQQDLQIMYNSNYFFPVDFYKSFIRRNQTAFWIQIGTAFEYDLSHGEIIESSICQPFTHYGISKLLFSNYLLNYGPENRFIILRPFGMFGKYEDQTKIFPALISAQRTGIPIALSSGNQKRDYLFVEDFANFLVHIISQNSFNMLPKIMNLGSGKLKTIKEMSSYIADIYPSFNSALWEWGKLPYREGENDYFYNSSSLAFDYGLRVTDHMLAFKNIIDYYL